MRIKETIKTRVGKHQIKIVNDGIDYLKDQQDGKGALDDVKGWIKEELAKGETEGWTPYANFEASIAWTIAEKPKLPRRAMNSPLIKYARFMDGTCINIVQFNKPYANGSAYAIYNTKDYRDTRVGSMAKTLKKSLVIFNDLIRKYISESDLDRIATTNNY